MIRVLSIAADRSKRGVMVPGTPAFNRQKAYAENLGTLDIVGFSIDRDGFQEHRDGHLHIVPTRSLFKILFGFDALFISSKLPWPDVVSAQDPFETGLVALLISRSLNIPLHVQVHTDFLSPAYARSSLINRIRVVMAGRVLRRATRIRVVSERIKRSIEERYRVSASISVLPIFADTERVQHAHIRQELRDRYSAYGSKVVYVGRLEREKNPCLALDAFAKAAPSNAAFVIVGTGSERSLLERRARQLGVQERVHFEGEQDAAPYFHLADIVLAPSRYEGYGLTIVEALSTGTPVLAADVGIAREAGAIITSQEKFADDLAEWFKSGPKEAQLRIRPYESFEQYVRAYCDDIRACEQQK